MLPPAHVAIFAALSTTARGLITAGAIVLAGIAIGFIVDRVIVGSIRRLAISTSGKIDDIIANALKGVARWGFFLAGVYFALPFLPLPASIDDKVTIGMRLAVLIMAIFVVARFASGIAEHYAHRILPSSASLAKVMVNAVVLCIGMLVIFQTMGIQITPFLTALGVGGLALALALQDTLSNFFSGMQILALKQINPGDYIRLDTGQDGYVFDVGWRNTTLRMVNNNIVIVPNTKLAQAIVTNFTLGDPDFNVRLTVGVAYGSDLEKVERVSVEVARAVVARIDGAVKEFDPILRYHTFAESSIQFNLVVRCTEFAEQFLIQHELIKELQQRYAREGIEVPFPIRTVVMKGGAS